MSNQRSASGPRRTGPRYEVREFVRGYPPKRIGYAAYDTERFSFPVMLHGREYSAYKTREEAQVVVDELNGDADAR